MSGDQCNTGEIRGVSLVAQLLQSLGVTSSVRLSKDDPRVGYPLSSREWSIVNVFNSRHRNTVETKYYDKFTGAVER